MALSPQAFERFCQRLLREAGFEQVEVTGRSGDGGIDGVGLFLINGLLSRRVLFQCKRYGSGHVVGSSAVRDFRGAMMGRTESAIIVTTSTFSPEARREAGRDGVPAIELLDMERIVDLCRNFQLGLKAVQTFVLDRAFFQQFD